MNHAFEPQPIPAVRIKGEDALFPVRRIYCVGQNYAAHAREMGADPTRQPPFFFMKPADAVVEDGAAISYPSNTSNLHHEIELVVAIGKGGKDIAADRALDHVFGYAVGLDLTRRDRQAEMKATGKPWEIGKGFDRSAPCSEIVRSGEEPAGRIWLKLDGELKQEGQIADLIWSVRETISILSRSWELQPGDLIFTGTPEGVGPVAPGQTLNGGVDGVGEITLTIADTALGETGDAR
jgi:fumarylpyruvate hydrolase